MSDRFDDDITDIKFLLRESEDSLSKAEAALARRPESEDAREAVEWCRREIEEYQDRIWLVRNA